MVFLIIGVPQQWIIHHLLNQIKFYHHDYQQFSVFSLKDLVASAKKNEHVHSLSAGQKGTSAINLYDHLRKTREDVINFITSSLEKQRLISGVTRHNGTSEHGPMNTGPNTTTNYLNNRR